MDTITDMTTNTNTYYSEYICCTSDTIADTTPDTDTTGISLSYSMDAMSVSAFTKTVSTSGDTDIDSSGFGFSYDMGGATLKAGVVDADDQQLIDFGVSFSF